MSELDLEAFPDSECIFEQAFAAADPAPRLLQIPNEHPTYSTVHELVISYTEAIERNPFHGDALAVALAQVASTPQDRTALDSPLFVDIYHVLADQHFKVDYGSHRVMAYGPYNSYLLDSLLAGLSERHNLTATLNTAAAIDKGLNASPDEVNAEIFVVGACIQLLLHSSDVVTDAAGSYKKTAASIAKKSRAQKAAGTVKQPRAVEVLELTIAHAESSMKPENKRGDVWALLFGDQPAD